jgi:hypothetical protein
MKKIILTAAALALSTSAMAGPSWTYAQLGAVIGDSGTKDQETQGVALAGSFGFGIWHVQAEVGSGENKGGKNETSSDSADVTAMSIRGGLHPALTDNTDFVLDLGYTDVEADDGSTKDTATAIDIRTGVRSNIGKVELNGFISLAQFDGEGSTEEGRMINYSVGTQYNFTDAISAGVVATVGREDNGGYAGDGVEIYGRWSF